MSKQSFVKLLEELLKMSEDIESNSISYIEMVGIKLIEPICREKIRIDFSERSYDHVIGYYTVECNNVSGVMKTRIYYSYLADRVYRNLDSDDPINMLLDMVQDLRTDFYNSYDEGIVQFVKLIKKLFKPVCYPMIRSLNFNVEEVGIVIECNENNYYIDLLAHDRDKVVDVELFDNEE